MSAKHAMLRFVNDGVLITDCNSKTGTIITNPNEETQRIEAGKLFPIQSGATIQLGTAKRCHKYARMSIFIKRKKSFSCRQSLYQSKTREELESHHNE